MGDMARIALVTGGAGGIGRAICTALARDGFSIAVADLDGEAAKLRAAELPGARHHAFAVDVTEEASVAALFDAAEQTAGAVTALICVAGGTVNTRDYRPRVEETTLADWQWTEAVNARGTFLCIREYLRRRRATPVPNGRIVTFSSLAGQAPGSPTGVAYAAAKAAVLGLTRYVAQEVGPLGITANAISPGAVDTSAFWTTVSQEQGAALLPTVPLRRLGTPEDIAAAVAFLVSPAAAYMTGCTLDVNGGRQMR
jgi:NAD(P)-dependent dehydrogenase (short-subunit alcohol dehydrogenase family)